jgi:hypothetical protein
MWTDKDREKYKDNGSRYPSDLTNAEWNVIKPGTVKRLGVRSPWPALRRDRRPGTASWNRVCR